MKVNPTPLQCPCEGAFLATVFAYDAPPKGEIRFKFSSSASYHREELRCGFCSHFITTHDLDTAALYTGDYVDSNYGNADGIKRTFERVIALDSSQSDNAGRVERILGFAAAYFSQDVLARPPQLLDVGSGLGVFPYKMKEAGWDCTALDPDVRSINHVRTVVGVRAIQGDFMDLQNLGRFDVITFNKVLEHVEDPVAMLAVSQKFLRTRGFIYVELPDGETAVADGFDREEFFIDHPHVFSLVSLGLMVTRAGFQVRSIERLQEPSTKYTLSAFLTLPN